MDKSSLLQEIGLLKTAYSIAVELKGKAIDLGNGYAEIFKKTNLDLAEISILSQAYDVYQSYNGEITSLGDFCKEFGESRNILNGLIESIKKEANITEDPELEISAVPSNLEAMVAAYHENEVSKADLEDTKPDSISAAIKRALKTQAILRKAEIKKGNIKEPDEDKFFAQYVDTKDGNRQKTEYEIRQALAILVSSQITDIDSKHQIELVNKLIQQVESGTVEMDNYKELDAIVEALAIPYGHNSVFEEIVELTKEQIILEDTDADPEKVEEVNLKIRKLDIDQDHFKPLQGNLEREDYEGHFQLAKSKLNAIQTNLQKVIPNPQLPFSRIDPLAKSIKEVEKAINLDKPSLLSQQTSAGASRIEPLMGGIVGLVGKGLTKDEFNKLKSNPNSNLSRLLEENRGLSKRIENALNKVYNSKLYPDVLKGMHDPRIPAFLNPKAALENKINQEIGKHMRREIRKKFGDAAFKKVEAFIIKHGLQDGIKNFASAAAQKLLIAAAKKAGIKVAEIAGASLIASLSAAAGISTGGVTLILQAAWFILSEGFKKIKSTIQETFNISDQDIKNGRNAALAGLGALALTGFAIKRGWRGFAVATQAAVISAVGIIILSLTTIAVFLTLTFLTAPLLSTFVQFDSMRKVDYEQLAPDYTPPASECTWPVKGHFVVAQGPLGLETHKDGVQGIDIMGTSQSPVYAVGPGKVVHSGFWWKWPIYGNTIIIETKTTTGTFQVWYNHLSEMGVNVGQDIKQGDQIGRTGNTGISLGWTMADHLHMEYRNTNFEAGTVEYNKCAAGGVPVPEKCVNNYAGASDCNYKGQLIYTDTTP